MSSPRERQPDDGSEWHEPPHLGGAGEADGTEDPPNFVDRRKQPRESDHSADRLGWEPPGWDLPTATPDQRPDAVPSELPPEGTPTPAAERPRGSLFGSRSRARDPEMVRAFSYEGDRLGAQSWALQHGWTVADGSGAE